MRKSLIGEFTENLHREDSKMGGLLASPHKIFRLENVPLLTSVRYLCYGMGSFPFREPLLGWRARTRVANLLFQASFMVYLSIEYSVGKHGGGTHQWNLLYKDVQYNRQVSSQVLLCVKYV